MNIKDSRPTGGLKLLYAKGLKNLKVFLADVKKDWSHPVLYLSNYRLDPKDIQKCFLHVYLLFFIIQPCSRAGICDCFNCSPTLVLNASCKFLFLISEKNCELVSSNPPIKELAPFFSAQ